MQAAIERLAILQVWRNFMKSFSEKRQDQTPAQRLGFMQRRLSVGQLLRRRLFPGRIRLPRELAEYYERNAVTTIYPRNRRHALKLAC